MNSAQDQDKEQARTKCDCPLCALGDLARRWREKSPALGHFHQAHLEVMKGLRALMDECIDKMEDKPAAEGEPRVTKIEVE